MTKQELIKMTLKAMRNARHSIAPEEYGSQDTEGDDSGALSILTERLPEGDIKTCQDTSTGVECCDTCHTFIPHYEMYLETLPTGELAWICCSVRSAVRNPGGAKEIQGTDWIDLEEALGGGLRKANRSREEGE